MDANKIAKSIAYCGLICPLCQSEEVCSCKTKNRCGKKQSEEGCYQYTCCTEKGINGCWECNQSPCGKDMLAPKKIKMRAFVQCIKEDGLEEFSKYIVRNIEKGVVYHHNGVRGDYDLETEEEVLNLLRSTKE